MFMRHLVPLVCSLHFRSQIWELLPTSIPRVKIQTRVDVATIIGIALLKLSSSHVLGLKDYPLLPNELKNIVSIPLLVKEGYEFSFRDNNHQICYCNKLVGTASLVNGLYYLNLNYKHVINVVTNKGARDAFEYQAIVASQTGSCYRGQYQ